MRNPFKPFHVVCDDKRSLAASLYPPARTASAGSTASGGTVIVNSATGVKRGYYDNFARFLAGRGCTVVLWDADTGRPFGPALSWRDSRAQAEANDLASAVPDLLVASKSLSSNHMSSRSYAFRSLPSSFPLRP